MPFRINDEQTKELKWSHLIRWIGVGKCSCRCSGFHWVSSFEMSHPFSFGILYSVKSAVIKKTNWYLSVVVLMVSTALCSSSKRKKIISLYAQSLHVLCVSVSRRCENTLDRYLHLLFHCCCYVYLSIHYWMTTNVQILYIYIYIRLNCTLWCILLLYFRCVYIVLVLIRFEENQTWC